MEGRVARKQDVENDTSSPHIRRRGVLPANDNLWSHISNCPSQALPEDNDTSRMDHDDARWLAVSPPRDLVVNAPCEKACIPESTIFGLTHRRGAVRGDRLILVRIKHPRQAKIGQLDDRIRLFCLEQNVLRLDVEV